MKIAVLSVTRERLEYTQNCFATLEDNAGCGYDHFVFDQGSSDGTSEWLQSLPGVTAVCSTGNVGISRAMNHMIDRLSGDYDVVVKFDNDCELLTPDTLRDVCWLAFGRNMILSPKIHGLRNPPMVMHGTDRVDVTPMIGGIFMAIPATVFSEFRYSESNPVWGGDDVELCHWFRRHGGTTGYVRGYHANHYETTDGQHERFPWYFERRILEGGPA